MILLFLFRPIDRIKSLMGDMGQLTLTINNYQIQVGLRLLELNLDRRETIGLAADKISRVAAESMRYIQSYFERNPEGEAAISLPNSPAASARKKK